MMNASPHLIYEKAVARYLRDAERLGRAAEEPVSAPEQAVDIQARRVHLEGRRGPIGTYTFALTKRGYIRFRPLWDDEGSEFPPPPESETRLAGKPRLRTEDVTAVARLMRNRGDAAVREAALRLGVSASEIGDWQTSVEQRKTMLPEPRETASQELRRLRLENDKLKQDRDFLAQACAFFAREACGSR